MYHSVTFGNKNTYSDWHLVPESRPVITLPEPKITTVDIPGANGVLDLSESLTKYPVYNNRTGSIKFHVLNDKESWTSIYSKIASYLQGRRRTLTLEDDPNYYYEGRMKVAWTSNNNGTWSDVEISYDLDPYKYYKQLSTVERPALYSGITVNSTSVTKNLGGTGTVGIMPVVPTFVISSIGGSGVTISLTNSELGISNRSKTISSNGSRTFYDMILSDISGSNTCNLTISGKGTVNISFRRGAL